MEIIKVKTYVGCTDDYMDNIVKYPINEDSVAVMGYGVDVKDPENTKRQFKAMAKYYGNNQKNPFIQYIMSFSKETAPDAKTAMAITEKVLNPLIEDHQVEIGIHKKQRDNSYYHSHSYVGTTNINIGKMLYANNMTNFNTAQRLTDITQQEAMLIIEKNDSNHNSKPYKKLFKPHKVK